MMQIMLEKWDKNCEKLKEKLASGTNFNECSYGTLVKVAFDTIFNEEGADYMNRLDVENMTTIDNGDYQGTLLFLIPFSGYQPSEYEYLMTYVNYGSCSGCDTLQAIQEWGDEKLTESQIADFMTLCKDLISNAIKPYNNGWRYQVEYDSIDL